MGDNTKMVTVLIPTFKRPELLRTALDSVSKQTYKHCIVNVIVSENGLEDNSRALCEEFSDLNITYIYQQVQLPHLEHWKWLISQVKEGYTAFLCDDDWWSPCHIEIALKSLERNSSVVSYFSHFSYALDEHKVKFINYEHAEFMDINCADFNNYDFKVFNSQDVFTRSFIFTPFHFSSVVCRAAILTEAVAIFDKVHQTYADRILWAVLSTYGDLLYNPLVTTIVRYHLGQDSNNFSSDEWRQYNQSGSSLILELANIHNIDVKGSVNKVYYDANETEKSSLNKQLAGVFVDRGLLKWYEGYDNILLNDKQLLDLELKENSYKIVAKRKIMKILRSIMS